MKTCLYIALLFIPLSAAGNTALKEQIATACQRHAISLSGDLKSSLLQGMTEKQTTQIQQTAMISCTTYLNKTLLDNPTAKEIAVQKSREEMIENETTQEKIERWLSEEPQRNAGHKRLKKR